MSPGRCFGVGVGPGDPELLTLKAARVIRDCPTVAYFAAARRDSNARRVVAAHLDGRHTELALVFPVTTEPVGPARYETLLADFYDQSAKRVAEVLDGGRDVAVLCEGDPLFFGSYMYLHHRLRDRYETEVVPGVSSVAAAGAVLGAPLAARHERFVVLSGGLPADQLDAGLADADAAVVVKIGRHLAKVRAAVTRAGLLDRAHYLEWATLPAQRVVPLGSVGGGPAPYFSLVVVPSVGVAER